MNTILGNLIGGIGVFFVDVVMLTKGLKQTTGRKFRMLVAKWTGPEFLAGLVDAISEFISQSSACGFIVASLIATEIMSVRNALSIILRANAGEAFIILPAVLNIKTLIHSCLGWRVYQLPLKSEVDTTTLTVPFLALACFSTA